MEKPSDSKADEAVKSDDSISMKMTCLGIRTRFPKVNQISTEQLAQWLSEGKSITLLDARPEHEYRVSRLAGAVRVDPDNIEQGLTQAERALGESPANQPAVVYCSVGYRSSMVADKLLDKWKTDTENSRPIYNLEGSLFKWANENRPIIDSKGASTRFVHPYNSFWGKLLDTSRRFSDGKGEARL